MSEAYKLAQSYLKQHNNQSYISFATIGLITSKQMCETQEEQDIFLDGWHQAWDEMKQQKEESKVEVQA